MKAVIISSSYSYLERVELLNEFYKKQGYETTVLLTDYIHTSKTYADWTKENYIFIKTKPYKKNISVQRLYSHHGFAKDVAVQLDNMQIDLLHVLLPANSLAKVTKEYKDKNPDTKLYFDIIDLWPETLPIAHFKNAYPFQKWRNLRDRNMGNADGIYCECDLFQKVLRKEKDERFRVLYWVKKDEPIRSKPQLNDEELHLCYLGSINNVIDIDYIVNMCDEFRKQKKVTLHIIGDGEKKEELLQKLSFVDVKIIYHGLIYDLAKKQEIFDQCHFGLNIMKKSVCVGLTMKSLDYFRAGLPLINNIKGDTWDMIEDYHVGFNGYQKVANELGKLQQEEYLQMRENVRSLYEEKFTKEAFFQQMYKGLQV